MRSTVNVDFFFSSRRRHTRFSRDWSSDVCSSDLDRLVVQHGAVVDGGDTGADGGLDALGAVRVRGDLALGHLGRVHDRPNLFRIDLQDADRIAGREHAAGRADLDDVGAVLDLVPDGGDRLVDAVGDALLDAAVRVAVRAVAVGVAVSAGDAEGEAGRDDAWAGHEAVVDRVAQRDVGPLVGADVAHGGEPGEQRDARVLDADDRGVAGPLVQPVVAVAAAGIAVQVGVRVDETGHHGVPGQVDHLGAARDVHVRPHRRDAFTTHDDGRVLGDPPGGGVEKSARADRDDALGGRLCLRRVR